MQARGRSVSCSCSRRARPSSCAPSRVYRVRRPAAPASAASAPVSALVVGRRQGAHGSSLLDAAWRLPTVTSTTSTRLSHSARLFCQNHLVLMLPLRTFAFSSTALAALTRLQLARLRRADMAAWRTHRNFEQSCRSNSSVWKANITGSSPLFSCPWKTSWTHRSTAQADMATRRAATGSSAHLPDPCSASVLLFRAQGHGLSIRPPAGSQCRAGLLSATHHVFLLHPHAQLAL